MDTVEYILQLLLAAAVLAPLASFVVILLAGPFLGKQGIGAGYLATLAIVTSGLLSLGALGVWVTHHWPQDAHHGQAVAEHEGEEPDAGEDAADAQGAENTGAENTGAENTGAENTGAENTGAENTGAENTGAAEHELEEHGADLQGDHGGSESEHGKIYYSGHWYTLGQFGKLRISIGYYIDALTICMFCMVTLIASCIHFYAQGYMHDELHDVTDHEVTLGDGHHLHRPGRYHRFFQYLSLFCFSMLGLVVSGNVAMTFVFWELVGICSYFLIGFYVERHSASTAANKAFIVNRVGDFGMILGLMAIWSSLGTFQFDEMFAQVRPDGDGYVVPDSMVRSAAGDEIAQVVMAHQGEAPEAVESAVAARVSELQSGADGNRLGYGLLVLAGVGIFCGCVGKSAQFPLHVWLPDAMEGPTPVSALVHSATMVAAGVFLVARFYPMFVPEVLLVIALIGTITLFLAATIAITATDIKRVLAYSTVSQLGYMMLALGVGGWLAGVMHLFTHAFFKSLLFMCSGSVIHAVHTNEMPLMGGLRRKMPWTAYTMLIGCLAIAGAGIPFVIGFSGYYSKDAILEQALLFKTHNGGWGTFFFLAAAVGAGITAFYMFRLWFLTFAGKPRDAHRYDHAHESPKLMYVPLVVLAIFAIGIAWSPSEGLLGAALAALTYALYRISIRESSEESAGLIRLLGLLVVVFLVASVALLPAEGLTLRNLLEQARPAGIGGDQVGVYWPLVWKDESLSHEPFYVLRATSIAFFTAFAGVMFAVAFYGLRKLDPADVRNQFPRGYNFLVHKWWFDELYEIVLIKPTHFVAGLAARIDLRLIDGLIHLLARTTRRMADFWEMLADRSIVDGSVNALARMTYSLGLALRVFQTGRLRQYVMFIVLGTVIGFLLLSVFWSATFAG